MKKSLLALLTLSSLMTSAAYASDSTWLLCKASTATNPHSEFTPVVNVFEHRSPNGRQTEVTILYGAHLMTGSFDNSSSDSAAIFLKSANGNKESFHGSIAIDYSANQVTLAGDYNENVPSSVTEAFSGSFACEQLN